MTESDVVQCQLTIIALLDRTLKGKVQITTSKPIIITEAFIEIFGTAVCKFNFDKICVKFPLILTKNTSLSRKEHFFYTKCVICQGSMKHKHKKDYLFQCDWPLDVPGTWTGDCGSIKYTGKITVKSNSMTYNHSQELFVKFKKKLHLEKSLIKEGNSSIHRKLFIIKSVGEVSVAVWTPMCGFAIGQSIPVLCTIINQSELHFAGLIFVLTRIDFYKSAKPVVAVKKVRTDVCRVARMVDVHRGKYEYFTLIKIHSDFTPTMQYERCISCQSIYELWVSLQGTIHKNNQANYRFIHTPIIPITIGTSPLLPFDGEDITDALFESIHHIPNKMTTKSCVKINVVQLFAKSEQQEGTDELSNLGAENLQRQLQFYKNRAAVEDNNLILY